MNHTSLSLVCLLALFAQALPGQTAEQDPETRAVRDALMRLSKGAGDGELAEPMRRIDRYVMRVPSSRRAWVEDALLEVLQRKASSADARRFACRALLRTAPAGRLPELVAQLGDAVVSDMVREGLTQMDARDVERALLAALRGTGAPGVRADLLTAMGSLGVLSGEHAMTAMNEALAYPDERVRQAACKVLAASREPGAFASLLAALKRTPAGTGRAALLDACLMQAARGGEADRKARYAATLAAAQTDAERARVKAATTALQVFDLNVSTGSKCEILPGGFAGGALLYIDREYTFTSVPAALDGAHYIKTAMADGDRDTETHLSFKVSKPVTVYVGFDSRTKTLPGWLASWEQTGERARSTDRGCDLRLLKKRFGGGTIVLGGNRAAGAASHYVVVVAE